MCSSDALKQSMPYPATSIRQRRCSGTGVFIPGLPYDAPQPTQSITNSARGAQYARRSFDVGAYRGAHYDSTSHGAPPPSSAPLPSINHGKEEDCRYAQQVHGACSPDDRRSHHFTHSSGTAAYAHAPQRRHHSLDLQAAGSYSSCSSRLTSAYPDAAAAGAYNEACCNSAPVPAFVQQRNPSYPASRRSSYSCYSSSTRSSRDLSVRRSSFSSTASSYTAGSPSPQLQDLLLRQQQQRQQGCFSSSPMTRTMQLQQKHSGIATPVAAACYDAASLDDQIHHLLMDVLQLRSELAAAEAEAADSACLVDGSSINSHRLETIPAAEGYHFTCQQMMMMADCDFTQAVSQQCDAARATVPAAAAAAAGEVELLEARAVFDDLAYASGDLRLASYLAQHQQQKQQHRECISATAAAAAFYGTMNDHMTAQAAAVAAGHPHPQQGLLAPAAADMASSTGLSSQAQAKLHELMIAQQMQLQIQDELLQMLNAAQ